MNQGLTDENIDQTPKGEKKIQPVAVPLGTLPERCTMTMHPEISARGSLIPAGNGSSLLSDTIANLGGPDERKERKEKY